MSVWSKRSAKRLLTDPSGCEDESSLGEQPVHTTRRTVIKIRAKDFFKNTHLPSKQFDLSDKDILFSLSCQ